MRHALVRHPSTPCEAVSSIEVDVERPGADALTFTYHLQGELTALRIPEFEMPERRDELWRTTCFEAFVRQPGQRDYVEFNVSPWGSWAAYAFDQYRQGMRNADYGAGLGAMDHGPSALELNLGVQVPDGPLDLNIAAVIEEVGGRISYWALKHPPGKPDFHHPDGFVLSLPAVERP